MKSKSSELAAIRSQAAQIRNAAIAQGAKKGVARGNIAGFDIDAYKKAVMGGASGTELMTKAFDAAGQHQIYRSQPEVAMLIDRLTKKQDVTNLAISNARQNSSDIKSTYDIRNSIIDTHPDPASVLPDITPVSGEGMINMTVHSIAPVPHQLYERQGVDDMVSNIMAATATPDEHVVSFRQPPDAGSVYGLPPPPSIYDGSEDQNSMLEPDDSSGTGFNDFEQNPSIRSDFLGHPDDQDPLIDSEGNLV